MHEKIIDSIKEIRDKRRRPDKESIFHHITSLVATNISKEYIEHIIDNLLHSNIIINKKTRANNDSYHLNVNIDKTPCESQSKIIHDYNICDNDATTDETYTESKISLQYEKLQAEFIDMKRVFSKEIADLKERVKNQALKSNSAKVNLNQSCKGDKVESEILYLRDENKNKNIIIKNLLENEKLLLMKNQYQIDQNKDSVLHSNSKINHQNEDHFIRPSKTASIKSTNQNEVKLKLNNRFEALRLINDDNEQDRELFQADGKNAKHSIPPSKNSSPKKKIASSKILKTKHITRSENNKNENNINNTKKPATVILGDSIVKKVIGKKIGYKIKENVIVKPFLGASIACMQYHVQPTIQKKPKRVVLHCGTNSLTTDETPEEITTQIIDLAKDIKNEINEVIVSSILPRRDEYDWKAEEVNGLLQTYFDEENRSIKFLNHINSYKEKHISSDGLHPNWKGISQIEKNVISFIGNR